MTKADRRTFLKGIFGTLAGTVVVKGAMKPAEMPRANPFEGFQARLIEQQQKMEQMQSEFASKIESMVPAEVLSFESTSSATEKMFRNQGLV